MAARSIFYAILFAFPKIGDMAVSKVTGPMIRDLLAEI